MNKTKFINIFVQKMITVVLMWELVLPDSAIAVSFPITNALAVQSMFKLMVTIAKVDGRFVIFEDKETRVAIQKSWQKDAEIRYFNSLKDKAAEIGLSAAGLKKLVKEHLDKLEFFSSHGTYDTVNTVVDGEMLTISFEVNNENVIRQFSIERINREAASQEGSFQKTMEQEYASRLDFISQLTEIPRGQIENIIETRTKNVLLEDLIMTRSTIRNPWVILKFLELGRQKFREGIESHLPMIVKCGDEYFITEGKHRCISAWLMGERSILAKVIEIKDSKAAEDFSKNLHFYVRELKGRDFCSVENTASWFLKLTQDSRDTEKLIILDLDDTLFDSRKLGTGDIERRVFYEVYAEELGVSFEEGKRAFNAKKRELGLQFNAQAAVMLGIAEKIIARRALLDTSQHIKEDKILQRILRHLKRKGYTFTVLTNSTKDEATKKVARIGIEKYLDGVFSAFELGIPKPDTEAFIKVSEEMGFSPDNTISVGDSLEKDIKPAYKAKMHTIHIEQQKDIYNLEEIVGEKRKEIAMGIECNLGQAFVDTLRVRAEEAKAKKQNIVIGIDTSWIPKDQFTRDLGLQQLINRVVSLNEEKGFGNIIVVRENNGKQLAKSLTALAENKTENPLSNMVVIGSSEVLDLDDFDVLRSDEDPENWAFFSKIVLPEGFPQNNYIRLLQLLDISVNLALGKTWTTSLAFIEIVQEGKRMYRFIPEIEPYDYSILEKTYRGQLKAMRAA
ncbi:MAG: HAD family hydrolase [Candidatus Omnitrophota bacterium]|nr:HAD family hydrolase [Candidatus Omnitrophota bacterium]